MCTHTHRLVAGICAIVGRQRLGLLGQTPGFKGRALLEANHILCQLTIHAWVCTHTCVYACTHAYIKPQEQAAEQPMEQGYDMPCHII